MSPSTLRKITASELRCWRYRWATKLLVAPRSGVRCAPPENDNDWAELDGYRQMREWHSDFGAVYS
jgi:hypothetical protein